MRSLPTIPLVAALFAAFPAHADPSFGFGFTLVLGGDKPDVAIGAKLFSSDEPHSPALSVGIDYAFGSGRVRPNVGLAYLGDREYADINLGFDLRTRRSDLGLGVGGLSSMSVPVGSGPAPAPGAGG